MALRDSRRITRRWWRPSFRAHHAGLARLALLVVAALPAATAEAATISFTLAVSRKPVSIGSGLVYNAWTYDGEVPGPVLKAREGDQVNVTLVNHTADAHGIDIHAAQVAPK